MSQAIFFLIGLALGCLATIAAMHLHETRRAQRMALEEWLSAAVSKDRAPPKLKVIAGGKRRAASP